MKNALRLIRAYHDLNQSDAAAKVGLSKSYISELERGEKKVTLEVLEKYANAFKVPLSSLLLFAENTEDSDRVERARIKISDKVIKMLDWVDSVAEEKRDHTD